MPVETPVTEIMSTPVERIDRSDSVGAAAQALIDQGIGSLVVGTDEIEGIITESDIVEIGRASCRERVSSPV